MDTNSKNQNSEIVAALSNPKASPERNLACAVVLQAYLDCAALFRKYGLDGVKRSEPYLSLAYPTRSMRMWCELADIDPDVMADRFRVDMRSEKTAAQVFARMHGKDSKWGVFTRTRDFVEGVFRKVQEAVNG